MIKRKNRPCGDRLLVRLKNVEKTTAGGIVTPDQYRERDQFATQEAYLIDIGKDAWLTYGDGQPWAKKGDLLKILKYSGENDETIEDGQVYRVIKDTDVVSVYEGEGLND